MNKEKRKKLQLGLLVLGSVILFVVGLFYIGAKRYLFRETFQINAIFDNVSGLRKGDYVWLSGVNVGVVKEIVFTEKKTVMIKMQLEEDVQEYITEDAVAAISTEGLVGNKLIIIYPGKGNVVERDDTIKSLAPLDVDDIMRRLADMTDEVTAVVNNLASISGKIDTGQGLLPSLINDTSMRVSMRRSVENVEQVSREMDMLTTELNQFANKLTNNKGLVSTLTDDTLISQRLKESVANMETVSEHSVDVLNDLETVSQKMKEGDGALGVLLSDSSFARNLRKSMINIRESSRKFDQNMEALQNSFLLRGFFRRQERKKEKEGVRYKKE